jgi:predicted GIY-YIG superfamily endonuclease
MRRPLHHRVYVVRLQNPRRDGRDGYYVGMTGLALEERFANHKRGYKSAGIVRRCGVGLAWDLFEGIPVMSYKEALLTESTLADDLRDLGYLVYGPTNRKPDRGLTHRARRKQPKGGVHGPPAAAAAHQERTRGQRRKRRSRNPANL